MPSARFKVSIQKPITADLVALSDYRDLVLLDDEAIYVPAKPVVRGSRNYDLRKILGATSQLTRSKGPFILPRQAVLDVEIASYLHARTMPLIDRLPQPWRSSWSISIGRVHPFEERATPQEGLLIASILNEDKKLVVGQSDEEYFPLVLWCAVH